MKGKWLLPLLFGIYIVLSFDKPVSASQPSLGQYDFFQIQKEETDRVIVRFKNSPSESSMKGLSVEDKQVGNKQTVSIHVPEGQDAGKLADQLEDRKDIISAEPDYLLKADYKPSDPFYFYQWHHRTIKSEDAWEKTKSSKNMKVAVLDDGFDLQHKDLAGNISLAYNAVSTTNDVPVGDHGTHVAGIIAAAMDNKVGVTGVAPGADILAINVFSEDGAYTSDVIDGIYYAVSQGAKIINMSLGSYDYSSAFNQAIQYAHQHGVLIVAAAGNDATTRTNYPSSYENVISVSSTDKYNNPSSFTNYGDDIDIAAPGSSIVSTLPGNQYGYMSGTSMASPVVAGVAALVWSKEPGLTNDEVARRLFSTADDLGAAGKDWFYGNGLVNAGKALESKELEAPQVNEISDQTTLVSGITAAGATVDIKIADNAWNGTADAYGNFTIQIPKQAAGSQVEITVKTINGDKSKPVILIVADKTAPGNPTLNEISDRDSAIIGKAEPGATVQAATGKYRWESSADENGHCSISIPKQKAGTLIEITAKDKAENTSTITRVIVKDKTAPAITVNMLTNKDAAVTGKTEKSAEVTFLIAKRKYAAAADKNGNFNIAIPVQTGGAELSYYVKDAAGNQSKTYSLKVIKKSPNQPRVYQVYSTSRVMNGQTAAKAPVEVKINNKTFKTKADSNGKFKLPITRQKKGTRIYTVVKDSRGNSSAAAVIVVK